MAFKPYCRACGHWHHKPLTCKPIPDDLRAVLVATDKAVVESVRFDMLDRRFSHPHVARNLRRMLTGAVDAVREAGSNVIR